jgi:hypothetical protein
MLLTDFITGLKVLQTFESGGGVSALLALVQDPSVATAGAVADDVLGVAPLVGVAIPYVGEIELAIAAMELLAQYSAPDPNPVADAQTAASSETDGKYVGR